MVLKLNIKPRIVKSSTKEGIKNFINRLSYSICRYGNYVVSSDGKNAVVINYEMVNKKTKQVRKNGNTVSKIVRRKEWTGYVYYIPINVLHIMNISVKQNTRNFVIKSL
jgi:hypothetical protein